MKTGNEIKKGDIDFTRIIKVADSLNQLCEELKLIFPGRDGVIEQLKFALLTRHHLMLFGPPGTGKSDQVNTTFAQIHGAKKISYALSRFSNEAVIFGMPNAVILRETGQVEFDTDGENTIFKSHLVELDEFLDASPPLARTLLGILNERAFKRGRTNAECELHTAVASTNRDPTKEVQNNPELEAVVDRFLFQCHVSYLETSEQRMQMYDKFLGGKIPSTTINYEDLSYFSEIVLKANQITDPELIVTYDKIIEEFSQGLKAIQGHKIMMTDRRKCKMLQLVEANALLNGRFEVLPEDLLAVRWAATFGDNKSEQDRFVEIAERHIKALEETMTQDVDKLQQEMLGKLNGELDVVIADTIADDTVVSHHRRLNSIKAELAIIKPSIDSTKMMITRLKERIAAHEKALDDHVKTDPTPAPTAAAAPTNIPAVPKVR